MAIRLPKPFFLLRLCSSIKELTRCTLFPQLCGMTSSGIRSALSCASLFSVTLFKILLFDKMYQPCLMKLSATKYTIPNTHTVNLLAKYISHAFIFFLIMAQMFEPKGTLQRRFWVIVFALDVFSACHRTQSKRNWWVARWRAPSAVF